MSENMPVSPINEIEILRERVFELRERVEDNEETLVEKDMLIRDYWTRIQRMRLSSRLKLMLNPFQRTEATRNKEKANWQSTLNRIFSSRTLSFTIKMACDNWHVAPYWGDYHFAVSLRKALMRLGCRVRIETFNEWWNGLSDKSDVVLVLRGLRKYRPKSGQVNLLWNISHPAKVFLSEYKSYDHVFVASESLADKLKMDLASKVTTLLQCTDESTFYRTTDVVRNRLLFVGNSKGIRRQIIDDVLPTSHELAVYGLEWDGLLEPQYWKGKYIPNEDLRKYYSGAGIVLCDHWEDMRRAGIISNRVFDALACGSIVVTDDVERITSIFPDCVFVYRSKDELKRIIDNILIQKDDKSDARILISRKILADHTFRMRAVEIVKVAKALIKNP